MRVIIGIAMGIFFFEFFMLKSTNRIFREIFRTEEITLIT